SRPPEFFKRLKTLIDDLRSFGYKFAQVDQVREQYVRQVSHHVRVVEHAEGFRGRLGQVLIVVLGTTFIVSAFLLALPAAAMPALVRHGAALVLGLMTAALVMLALAVVGLFSSE
ncbi:MAG: hypothetical protein AB1609_12660, partial [Bacillota bacterium]